MFRKIINNQQAEAKDKTVRQEARLEEGLNSVQPMGNEAANAELMDQMLNEINTGSNPEPNEYAGLEEEILPGSSGVRIPPAPDRLNDSDYLNNSNNIINEYWLESIGKGGRGSNASEKSDLIGKDNDDEDSEHIISTSSKKKEKKSKKKPDL